MFNSHTWGTEERSGELQSEFAERALKKVDTSERCAFNYLFPNEGGVIQIKQHLDKMEPGLII